MQTVIDILRELKQTNSTNDKLKILKKYKDNELFKKVLQMTYDKVKYTYGTSLKTLSNFLPKNDEKVGDLKTALSILEDTIATKKVTGHAASQIIANMLGTLTEEDAEIIKKIIDRDLKVNVGRTQINKVWKGLITKPVYMRCGVFNDKTKGKVKKWESPYIIQLKADGTYREVRIENGFVEFRSRSGEEYTYPLLEQALSEFPDCYMMGELTVIATPTNLSQIIEKMHKLRKRGEDTEKLEEVIHEAERSFVEEFDYIYPREIGNGMLKSDDVPHTDIVFDIWDFVTLEEYSNAGSKIKNVIPYKERFSTLIDTIKTFNRSKNIRVIEYHKVDTINEAISHVSEWMKQGLEGGVLKNTNGVFRDGTSPDQLKLKLVIELDMRITGFNDGKIGTKREDKVGSIKFKNDEGTIAGSCSGFDDVTLDDMSDNPEKYLGKIFTVQCNDLTQSSGSKTWSLSHPRYIEIRDDKEETDTLERAQELKSMAMNLK